MRHVESMNVHMYCFLQVFVTPTAVHPERKVVMRLLCLVYMFAILLVFFPSCRTINTDGNFSFIWYLSYDDIIDETLYVAIRDTALARGSNSFYNQAARMYMNQNPGVRVQIELFDAHNNHAVLIKLMSGDAPTLIDFSLLNFTAQARGFFSDWKPFIDLHPDFCNDKWQMNMLDAFVLEDELLILPTSVFIHNVFANSDLIDVSERFLQMQQIGFQDLMDFYYPIRQYLDRNSFFGAYTRHELFRMMLTEHFLCYERRFVNFNSFEFIERASFLLENLSIHDRLSIGAYADSFFFPSSTFVLMPPVTMEMFNIFFEDFRFANSLPFANENGEVFLDLGVVDFAWLLSRQTSALEKSIALDFVMFTEDFTDEIFYDEETGYSQLIASQISSAFFQNSSRYLVHNSFFLNRRKNELVSEKEIPFLARLMFENAGIFLSDDNTIDDVISKIQHIREVTFNDNMIFRSVTMLPESINTIINQIYEELWVELITVEEAAVRLQNSITLVILEGN